MIKKIMVLCLWAPMAYAVTPQDACELVDDTADTLMQLHQSGLSLGDVDINHDELTQKEAKLLTAMIEDAKSSPVYKIDLTRKKAIEDFKAKWQQRCKQETDDFSESTQHK